MENLKEQLKKLDKARLSRRADLAIRYRIEKEIWRGRKTSAGAFISSAAFYRPVAAALAVCLVISVIVPGYAYASPGVNINSPLYPLKLAVENVELKLAVAPEKKAEKLVKFSGRRLEEAVLISEGEDKTGVDQAVAEAIAFKKKAEPISSAATGTDGMEDKVETLKKIAGNVGVDAPDPVVDTVALAIKEFSRPKPFLPAAPPADSDANDDSTDTGSPLSATGTYDTLTASSTRQHEDAKQPGRNVTERRTGAASTEPAREDDDTDNESRPEIRTGSNAGPAAPVSASPAEKNDWRPAGDLERVRTKVERAKEELRSGSFPADQAETMVKRLEDKMKQAEKLKAEDRDQAETALQATEALSEHASSFINKAKDKDGKNNDKEDKDAKDNSKGRGKKRDR